MKHDGQCELRTTQVTPYGMRSPSCQCGSRAFALCTPCQRGQHLNHAAVDPMTGKRCQCDLEEAS